MINIDDAEKRGDFQELIRLASLNPNNENFNKNSNFTPLLPVTLEEKSTHWVERGDASSNSA